MKKTRRDFIRYAGLAGLGIAGSKLTDGFESVLEPGALIPDPVISLKSVPVRQKAEKLSVIGEYGPWASSLRGNKLPSLSFRRKEWSDLAGWKTTAASRLKERMAIPDIGIDFRVNAAFAAKSRFQFA